MGLGNEDDVHTAHWHGVTVQERSKRQADALVLLPGVTYTVDSIADNPGTWLFHCHVSTYTPIHAAMF
jgi:manganese oxidase